eukprot:7676273-Karenia_brevis.AAC.1
MRTQGRPKPPRRHKQEASGLHTICATGSTTGTRQRTGIEPAYEMDSKTKAQTDEEYQYCSTT